MLRRLTEYHIDNYAKNEPAVRPVYQIKENISKVDLSVAPGWKFKAKYSISGNTLKVDVGNPYTDSKILVEMDPDKLGPSDVKETIVSIGKDLTKIFRMETHWKTQDGKWSLVGIRRLAPRMSTNITTSTTVRSGGYTVRENRVLWGWGYTY